MTKDAVGLPVLVACGDLSERLAPDRARAEEVAVYACGTAEPVLSLSPLDAAEVHEVPGGVEVLELAPWPFGKGGESIDVPIWKNTVALFPDLGPRVERTFAFVPPQLSAQEIHAAVEDYARWLRKPDAFEEPEAMVGRLLAAALSGNAEARHALSSWNAETRVDDDLAEIWTDASQLYQEYAKATGKVPVLEGKGKR
ncbi:MAG TPA: hypothetical protein VGS22_04460 [Thermoanaerobaculia bacterium]|jgi:hypothetical protein|nr:hypothetical protein [Thermoanaerobaculia bacterium]